MTDVEVSLLTAGSCRHPAGVARRGAGRRPVDFPALVAVIRHPQHGVVLFDTGYTPRFFAETARFPASVYARATPVRCAPHDTAAAQLRRQGVDPEDVTHVVVSHFHADHVGGARDFPRARFLHRRGALERLRRAPALARLRHGFLPGLLPADLAARATHVEDLPRTAPLGGLGPGFDLLGDGSLVGVPLPGHQEGHLGLHVPEVDLLLVGDAVWSSRAVSHLELPHPVVRLITHDWRAYRETVTALHDLQRDRPGLLVVPSHCAEAITRARAALGTHR